MKEPGLVVAAASIAPFALPQSVGVCQSECLIDPDGVGSHRLVVNRFTLFAGQRLKGVSHPPGNDECYYVLSGRATLTLGGDPTTGAGGATHELTPHMSVFIPGGTYHALVNPHDEDFIILTIWPSLPTPGAQPFWDGRLQDWGTTYRRRDND